MLSSFSDLAFTCTYTPVALSLWVSEWRSLELNEARLSLDVEELVNARVDVGRDRVRDDVVRRLRVIIDCEHCADDVIRGCCLENREVVARRVERWAVEVAQDLK